MAMAGRAVNSLDIDLHRYTIQGEPFDVPKSYTIERSIGNGAWGMVCSATFEKAGSAKRKVAIKKIANVFDRSTFAKRTLRELRIMRQLRHENLIDAHYVFLPDALESFDDVYLVSELMETDLSSVLKSSQPLNIGHYELFLYQILRGLKFLHSAQVIHRDLKPGNILVNGNCDLKICDYGLARVHYEDQQNDSWGRLSLTEYVCTRWYRAPEVLCACTHYGKAMDIWSVGCIFAEMLRRKPLLPGKNTQHQLQLIAQCLGAPGDEWMERIQNEKCRKFMVALQASSSSRQRPLSQKLPKSSSKDVLDFVGAALRLSPEVRATVEELLEHPFLSKWHCPEDEPSSGPLDASEFEFERRMCGTDALREEIFLEALQYHPQRCQQYQQELASSGRVPCLLKSRRLLPGETQHSDAESQQSDDDDGTDDAALTSCSD